MAWAPKASEITDAYNNSSTSLADVAEELLRSERRSPEHENSSSSAGRLQEQLALQLEIALKAQDDTEVRTRPSHPTILTCLHKLPDISICILVHL